MDLYVLALVTTHFLCNAQAAQTPVAPADAEFCIRNFETVKIFLHPDVNPSEIARLPTAQRIRISQEGYLHYRSWLSENSHLAARLQEAAKIIVTAPGEETSFVAK